AAPSNCSPHPLTAAPKSTAHHAGAQRLYSTVIEPAVDTNPAQHHLSSFASQFVGIAFMGRRRRGAYDFGRCFSGFGHLTFVGIRGVVSLAAALAIPLTTLAGTLFPYRDLILFVTFGVIVVTLIGQGLVLPGVVRWLGLGSHAAEEREREHAAEL